MQKTVKFAYIRFNALAILIFKFFEKRKYILYTYLLIVCVSTFECNFFSHLTFMFADALVP